MSDQYSPSQIASLRWMSKLNPDGVGLFWPTTWKHGPVDDCEPLLNDGLAELRDEPDERGGYWLTDKGREVLSAHD